MTLQENPVFTEITVLKLRPHERKLHAARRKHVQYLNVHVIISLEAAVLSWSRHWTEKHGTLRTLGRNHVQCTPGSHDRTNQWRRTLLELRSPSESLSVVYFYVGTVVAYTIREFNKTTTVPATGTSLHKRFNEQYNACVRALSCAKQQREKTKFCVVWKTWTTNFLKSI